MSSPRIVFFGMRCAASAPPLLALLAAGLDVRGVVLPGPPFGPPVRPLPPRSAVPTLDLAHQRGAALPPLPWSGEGGWGSEGRPADSPTALAAESGIPSIEVTSLRHPDVIAAIASWRPDVIAVTCFPWRLPTAVLGLPPLGCVNVHPSLLPVGRGPEPVFWTLRRGERRTGATVHLMDAGFDTGPILAQAATGVPLGIRAPKLEWRLAELGGDLLVRVVHSLAAGTARPRAQDDARATRAPYPTAADWRVTTDLPAGWAYGFVRGVAPLGGPLELGVLATGERFRLRDALDHDPTGALPTPTRREGDELLVRFRPGTVRFALAETGG